MVADEADDDFRYCLQCSQAITLHSRFCRHCGVAQYRNDDSTSEQKWSSIKQSALFYGFDLVICCVASFIDVFKTLAWSIVFDIVLAIIAITFFCDKWSKNKALLKWPNFSMLKLLGYIGLAVTASLVVHFCVGWLNHALFSKDFYYYGFYAGQKYAPFLMIFFIAVMPALFEELAYRGYLLQNLMDVSDNNQAIFITSFLFSIMHLSILSLFWLIPFALALGYVRVKEQTIWYGVLMHFSFNATVCIIEILKYS